LDGWGYAPPNHTYDYGVDSGEMRKGEKGVIAALRAREGGEDGALSTLPE